MATFTYEADVRFSPAEGKRGQPVTVEVRFNQLQGKIQRVFLTVPGYGIMQNLSRKTDDQYTMTMPIPWEAPSGQYTLQISAINPDQERGPVIRSTYMVR